MRKTLNILGILLVAFAGTLLGTGTASAHHGMGVGYDTNWVSVADRTTPFPVDSSTITWDNGLDSSRINLTYRWWDCASVNGCIMIWEDPGMNPSWYGVTQMQWNTNGSIRGANIQLNPLTASTAAQRLKTTCHEIGHGLGLVEHPAYWFTGSCMVQGAAPPIVGYPDWHDFEVVNAQN